jgi:membrane protein DedA with SNARE-associated domain
MLSLLLSYFDSYGYWVVLFGVMLENAGLPVPGETILLAAGFFASQGHFSVPLVILVAAIGAVLGDNAGYYIGRRIGRATLARWGTYGGLTPKRLARFDRFFRDHGDKTILVARFITGLRVFAALLAGSAHMPWRRFAIYNMLGAILWSVTITLAGFFFGHSWKALERFFGRAGVIALLAVIVAALIVFWLKRRGKGEAVEDPEELRAEV